MAVQQLPPDSSLIQRLNGRCGVAEAEGTVPVDVPLRTGSWQNRSDDGLLHRCAVAPVVNAQLDRQPARCAGGQYPRTPLDVASFPCADRKPLRACAFQKDQGWRNNHFVCGCATRATLPLLTTAGAATCSSMASKSRPRAIPLLSKRRRMANGAAACALGPRAV